MDVKWEKKRWESLGLDWGFPAVVKVVSSSSSFLLASIPLICWHENRYRRFFFRTCNEKKETTKRRKMIFAHFSHFAELRESLWVHSEGGYGSGTQKPFVCALCWVKIKEEVSRIGSPSHTKKTTLLESYSDSLRVFFLLQFDLTLFESRFADRFWCSARTLWGF